MQIFFFQNQEVSEMERYIIGSYSKIHSGGERTFGKILATLIGITRYFVREALDECKELQIARKMQACARIGSIRTVRKFQRFQMDLVSLVCYKSENFGHKYVLNLIDCFGKCLRSFSLKNNLSKTVLKYLRQIFFIFSTPEILHSDNGKEFKPNEIKNLSEEFHIVPVYG